MISDNYKSLRQVYARFLLTLAGLLAGLGANAGVTTAGAEAGGSAGAVWYAVPAAFLLGVLAALAIYSRLQGRRPAVQRTQPVANLATATPAATMPTTVFLLQQGGDGAKHEVNHTPFRIGRATERNEVTLKHPSISRRHAQITLRKDGVYEIADMESLNGLFVNDRKVKSAPLADGDIIDIGDLTFRFTTRGE